MGYLVLISTMIVAGRAMVATALKATAIRDHGTDERKVSTKEK